MAAQGSTRAVLAALVGNGLIAITKFAAAAMTGSSAMFSEAVHSLVDTGNQVLLLHGMRRAKRPPDRTHPFGYAREIYFWAFVVAIMIFATGAGVSFYEGIIKIRHPEPIVSPHVNYIVLALAIVFESGSWYVAFREFRARKGRRGYFTALRHSKDPSLFTVLMEDTAAVAGLLIALFGIWLAETLDMPLLDGVTSIMIGLVLATVAIFLAYETKGLLIGEAAAPGVIADVRRLVAEDPRIERVNELLTMHLGPDDVLLNLSADFADSLSAAEVEAAIADLDKRIRDAHPEIHRIFVEAESRRRVPARRSGNEAPQ